MNKIPVYFMPGLAASSLIFEKIQLSDELFEIYLLDWKIPKPKESLQTYAKRMALDVKHEKAVLVGVSFGGVLVQEMASFLDLKKIIIVSSVKSNLEIPLRMKIAKQTKAYKLVPTGLVQNLEVLQKFSFGTIIKQRLKLYERYLAMREKTYLDWAIEKMLTWDRKKIDPKVIHIHGDADEVFPIKNIKKFIPVKGGTHIMILSKYKWFIANLPKIILED